MPIRQSKARAVVRLGWSKNASPPLRSSRRGSRRDHRATSQSPRRLRSQPRRRFCLRGSSRQSRALGAVFTHRVIGQSATSEGDRGAVAKVSCCGEAADSVNWQLANAMGDSNLQEKGKPLDSLNSTRFMVLYKNARITDIIFESIL